MCKGPPLCFEGYVQYVLLCFTVSTYSYDDPRHLFFLIIKKDDVLFFRRMVQVSSYMARLNELEMTTKTKISGKK